MENQILSKLDQYQKATHKKERVDYEQTFSPMAKLKSICILLSIITTLDYEIRQIDVKIAFLNGYLKESIYMERPEGFKLHDQQQKVYKLLKFVCGLQQASRLWNLKFDETIKTYGFKQNFNEPYVYNLINNRSMVFLVLYVDGNFLNGMRQKNYLS